MRKEFDEKVRKPAIKEDPNLEHLSIADFLDQAVDFKVAQDQEYLGYCIQEALRLQTTAPVSVVYEATEDVTLGKYRFNKNDIFTVILQSLHTNPDEYQRPMEFIPERFDNSNDISLTPAGKKRNVSSWAPFFGGNRVCFGKSLAEGELKIAAIYMTQLFDFKFEDPKY